MSQHIYTPFTRRRSKHLFPTDLSQLAPYDPRSMLLQLLLTPPPPKPSPPSSTVPFSPLKLARVLGIHDKLNHYIDPLKEDARCDQAFEMISKLLDATEDASFSFLFCLAYLPSSISAFTFTFQTSKNVHKNPYALLFTELLLQTSLSRWFRVDQTSRSVEFLVSIFGSMKRWFPCKEIFNGKYWHDVEQRDALDTLFLLIPLATRLLLFHQDLPFNPTVTPPSETETSLLLEFGDRVLNIRNALAALDVNGDPNIHFGRKLVSSLQYFIDISFLYLEALYRDETDTVARTTFWRALGTELGEGSWFWCALDGCQSLKSTVHEEGELRACARCLVVRYCSKQHQQEHWRIHKLRCRAPAW